MDSTGNLRDKKWHLTTEKATEICVQTPINRHVFEGIVLAVIVNVNLVITIAVA